MTSEEWRGGRDGGSRRRRIEGRGDHGKLECIGMEFSRPEGRELRMGWRDTDHPPLLDTHAHAHTHTHTHPNQSRGRGGRGNESGRGISDPETVFAKIKGQEDRSGVPSPAPGVFLSKPCHHPGATAGSADKATDERLFVSLKARPARNSTTQSN